MWEEEDDDEEDERGLEESNGGEAANVTGFEKLLSAAA